MKKYSLLAVLSLPLLLANNSNAETRLDSTAQQNSFFENIKQHCGKAFEGKVVLDTSNSPSFANKSLIMHVRNCSKEQLQIPFHVGKDSSRTWLITQTGSGMSLKHDHRHKDGSHDEATMYGGATIDHGSAEVQSFPADKYSKELFVKVGIPQSVTNTWQMSIYPNKFSYRLTRKGLDFRVDFDLTQPITPPPAPWGYKD